MPPGGYLSPIQLLVTTPILSPFALKLRPKVTNNSFLLSPKRSWDSQTFLHWVVINSDQRIVTHSENSITIATFPKEKFGTERATDSPPQVQSLLRGTWFPEACLQVGQQCPTADVISICTCEVRPPTLTTLPVKIKETLPDGTQLRHLQVWSNLGLFLFVGLCLFFSLIIALGHSSSYGSGETCPEPQKGSSRRKRAWWFQGEAGREQDFLLLHL